MANIKKYSFEEEKYENWARRVLPKSGAYGWQINEKWQEVRGKCGQIELLQI
jgi:hypothetical protein